MGRQPSGRCMPNTVDIYVSTITRDVDGGVSVAYLDTPTYASVNCSVQPGGSSKQVFEQDRQTFVNQIAVIFRVDPALKINDKVVWQGQEMFVTGQSDYAGRGSVFEYTCEIQS